jgi:hypothetical protein
MKKLLLLVLTAMLITACQQEKQRYFSESPEIETVKAGINAYESQDWESWKANLADTAKFYPNTTKGISSTEYLENTKAMVATLSSYGFDQDNTFAEMVIDKDNETWVNYWSTWKGTIAANGKELTIPVHLTIQFVNGKIVEEYGYWDMSGFMAAMQEIEAVNNMSVDDKAIHTTINKMIPIWNKNDHQALKELSIPNLIRNANGVRQASNQDEYAAMMTSFFTGFPDFKVALEDTKINGNKATISWRCTGTNNGEFLGNAPTNKKINIQGISVWTFDKEGKATQEDAFFDNLTMFNQLGITPPKS